MTEDVLKLQDFQQKKLSVSHLITGEKGNFIEHFNEKLQRKELILQSELKLLLHLCQTPDDMVVARDAIYRYHSENPNFASREFKYGPVFMRLCYELGLEEMAAAVITDTTLKGFFKDSTSFSIAIDMLFLKGAYKKALEVLRTMKIYNMPFNNNALLLACGTCYKLNTPESYKMCTSLIEEQQIKNVIPPRHAYCFAIALALRQNDVEMAQFLFSKIITTKGRLCINLKILTSAKSGEFKEVASILKDATLCKAPVFVKKPEFSQEVVDLVRLQCEGGPFITEINQLLSQLEQAGQVIQLTLDDLLCHTPAGKPKLLPLMDDKRTKSRQTLKLTTSTLLSE